jgi:hypothetical protein
MLIQISPAARPAQFALCYPAGILMMVRQAIPGLNSKVRNAACDRMKRQTSSIEQRVL